MKKLLSLLLILALVFSFVACNEDGKGENADKGGNTENEGGNTEEEDNYPPATERSLEYTLTGDGTAYLVTGIGTAKGDIVIVKEYNGKPVVAIGDYAFYNCERLTSVTIPSSITNIGFCAFAWCDSLASITVEAGNENYKSVDGNLYSKDGKTLIQYAIGKIDKNFAVPEGVTSIGGHAFFGCDNLTSVAVGNGVTSIGASALARCESLASITVDANNENYESVDGNLYSKDGKTLIQYAIGKTDKSFAVPEGVIIIGNSAFCDCKNLASVTIPDSVTTIGQLSYGNTTVFGNPFAGRTSLASITVDADNENYKSIDGNIYSKDGKTLIWYVVGEADKSFTIPEGVTSIGESAFDSCDSLVSVTIPNSVTSIGGGAFASCYALVSVTIPDSVTSIDYFTFAWCKNLVSVTIPNSVTNIDGWSFAYCENLTNINYRGTEAEWQQISKHADWDSLAGAYTITHSYTGEQ